MISNLYTDKELGLTYTKDYSIFRVWAPSQEEIFLCLYENYDEQDRKTYHMTKDEDGCFELKLDGDYEGKFYTYLVKDQEVADPYSFASSANSKRTAIIDLAKTNPEGYLDHEIPNNDKDKAIIVETHLADITIDPSSGADHRGLFLGAAQKGTNYNEITTGMDHFAEIGVTHVHLLPITDYLTVDENKPLAKYPDNYNWGYDQELYNNIEGSFSTNPNDPYSRIREFKTLIKNYHENGLSVVLDVVYNHTFRTADSIFQVLEPYYYYRTNGQTEFSNGSGCGNEVASERPMVRKFIIDSLVYLAKEYKLDGFRFDLMALTDIDTIMMAIEELRKINPNILIYGEPWMALPSPLPYDKQINIGMQKNKNFAIFNPHIRDNLKGDTDGSERGYLQGEYYLKGAIQEGIAGYANIYGNETAYAHPLESINYFNAHDNLIFNDKLIKSGVPADKLKDITYMGHAILLTSQGLPFLVAGNSFMRTKKMNHNSYNAPADINGIDWTLKEKNQDLFEAVKDLIKLRKDLGIFNMKTNDEVLEKLSFIDGLQDYLIGYIIKSDNGNYAIFHNVSDFKEEIDKSLFTEHEEIQHIFSNGFVDSKVTDIKLDEYSINVYKF